MNLNNSTKMRDHGVRMLAAVVAMGSMVVGGHGYADGLGTSSHPSDINSRAPFQFALIGDTRYNDEGSAHFGPMRDEINQDRKLKWVVHVGDILGGTPCSDELHYERLADFQAFMMPFIYTPGDNEWTDCHYSFLGGFNPIERLDRLREIFYPVPGMSLGHSPIKVDTQASEAGFEQYVENVRFVRGGIVFVTVHMVGSRNGLEPWNRSFGPGTAYDPTDTVATPRQDRLDEVAARIAAGVDWLDKAFQLANEIDSPGVFIVSHANPGFITRFETAPVDEGFIDWQAAIRKHAVNFRRPVVLAHGDTHTARIDKPLTAPTVPVVPAAPNPAFVENFTRVETFGFPDTHWIRVNVDPKSANVFSFEIEIVDANRREFVPIP
jgi:hypothetical protein